MTRFNEGGARPPEQPKTIEQYISQELAKQYRAEVSFLSKAGLLEILPQAREMGLLDITGQERPLPTPEAIAAELRAHQEIYQTKLNQGFNKMEFTPFGSPLAKLEVLVRKLLLKLHSANGLYSVDYNKQGEAEKVNIDLNANQPLFVWDQLEKADETGALVYDVQQFTKAGHGGKTKTELLEQATVFSGWHVSLVEDASIIPRAGKGRTIGNRQQLEAGQSPNDYLQKLLTNPTYANESGQTPEDELTRLIRSLLAEGRVIHDYQNNVDSLNYLLASWIPASENVSGGCWYRDNGQADLNGSDPGNVSGNYGVAPAVRMGRLKV